MITAGKMATKILEACNGLSDKTLRDRVWRLMNDELFDIVEMTSCEMLRDKVNLDFSASGVTSSGLVLPGDLIGIDAVRDEDGYDIPERDRADVEPHEFGYRYYRFKTSSTPLYTGEDCVMNKNSVSFVSQGLKVSAAVSSVVGQYVNFKDYLGFYKITAQNTTTGVFTITPNFGGESETRCHFVLRHPRTDSMVMIDEDEAQVLDEAVDVYYWKYPTPLYNDYDIIPMARTELLELRVLRKLPQAKMNRPVSLNELQAAEAAFKKSNPSFPRSARPRDKRNNPFNFTTCPFKRRT